MKRNTYRKNSKAADPHTTDPHTAGFEHKAVDDHTVDDRHARQNRQVAVAADDTVETSTTEASTVETSTAMASTEMASSITPAVAQAKRTDLHDDQPLAFTKKNMTDLVIAYEAYQKLEQSIMLLTGVVPDNPILEGLQHIDEIIMDISPVFDDMEDYDEYDTFVGILEDPMMSAEQKAEILMNWSSSLAGSDSSSTVDNHSVDDDDENDLDEPDDLDDEDDLNDEDDLDYADGAEDEDLDNLDDLDDLDDTEHPDRPGVLPFTLDHMELLLTAYDGIQQLKENILELTGNIDMDSPEKPFWKLHCVDEMLQSLSPLYSSTVSYPVNMKMYTLDWRDSDNLYARVLDGDGGSVTDRAKKLMML